MVKIENGEPVCVVAVVHEPEAGGAPLHGFALWDRFQRTVGFVDGLLDPAGELLRAGYARLPLVGADRPVPVSGRDWARMAQWAG